MQLRPDETVENTLQRLLTHERQLTRLEIDGWIPYRGEELTLKHLSSLTALRHLDAFGMDPLTPNDCHAVGGLTHLTTLGIRECIQVNIAVRFMCKNRFCNLQHWACLPMRMWFVGCKQDVSQSSFGVRVRQLAHRSN